MTHAPTTSRQLISYIAPAAPATRRAAGGDERLVRAEVGFTPRWYRKACDIAFDERWHTDAGYRQQTAETMRAELRRRFPGYDIGGRADEPLDTLTGVYGGCLVPALYGVRVRFAPDRWPACEHDYLTRTQTAKLEPPSLECSPLWARLRKQLECIERRQGVVRGYVNWQGVLNNAFRLRGEELFLDLIEEPGAARHLFDCVYATMVDGARRLYAAQRDTGFVVQHFTVSNCLVNMISPATYREHLLEYDSRLAREFGLLGIHNCAWDATPYLSAYAEVPHVGYIDMGLSTDLSAARAAFPRARRAVMYAPTDLRDKPPPVIEADLRRIASELAPCDIVFADIDVDTPDDKVRYAMKVCQRLSDAA